MEDNHQLLRQYVSEKSQDAFAELVRRYVNLVYSSALRKLNGDAHRAEDVAQEVFVKLARHAPALVNCRVLSGWLYSTAHNTAVKAIRSDSRRRHREERAHAIQNMNQPNPECAGWDEIGPLIDDTMQALSRGDRDAVLLRFFEGRSFGEIGARLGVSENTARMRVVRALEKLSGLLAQRGIGSTSAALSAMLAQQAVIAAPAALAATISASAIAVGPAVGVTLAGLGFMSTGKLAVALGMVAAGAIGFSIREAVLRKEAEQMIASLRSERVAARGQTAVRSADSGSTMASAAGSISPGSFDVQTYEQEKARQLAERAKANALVQIKVAGSPEMLQLRLKPFRATAYLHFAGLYRMLNLPAEKTEAFAKLVEEKFWAVADLNSSAMAQDVSRVEPAFHRMREQSLAPIEDKIRALLGETGYRAYTEYEAVDSGRRLVEQLSGRLALAASPLTLDQAGELARIFTRNALKEVSPSASWFDRSMGYAPDGLTLADIQWDNSLPQMQKALSADQVFLLNALYLENTLTAVADRSFEKRVRELSAR
jgi:RNA polymerase sigma factor (sigma-70 family)